MDPALVDASWIMARVVAGCLVCTAAYYPFMLWTGRFQTARLPDTFRRQYGLLVNLGWAGLGAVREDHRAVYKAWRKQVLKQVLIRTVVSVTFFELFLFFIFPPLFRFVVTLRI